MDRRKFFRMFTAGSVGLTATSKLALAEDLTKWMLSPQKTIFIPAPPKLVVPEQRVDVVPSWMMNNIISYAWGDGWRMSK